MKKKSSFPITALIAFILASAVIIYFFSRGGCDSGAATSRVSRVIDGDTVVISGGIRVRYIGIDTPETDHGDPAIRRLAFEATEFNKRLVLGKKVTLRYDAQRHDKYGRLLAYVYADGVFVNAALVKHGYAKVYTVVPNVKHSEYFVRLQRFAREHNKGLWAR
jgi:micrococcal nuclease